MDEQEMFKKAGLEILHKNTKENKEPFDQIRATYLKVKCKTSITAFKKAVKKEYSLINPHIEKDKKDFSLTGTLIDEKDSGIYNISLHKQGISILPKYEHTKEGNIRLLAIIKKLDSKSIITLEGYRAD